MKRVCRNFTWKSSWWKSLLEGRGGDTDLCMQALISGCNAYVHKQVRLLQKLDDKFTLLWKAKLKELKVDEVILDDL